MSRSVEMSRPVERSRSMEIEPRAFAPRPRIVTSGWRRVVMRREPSSRASPMRRSILLLCFAPLLLAVWARAGAAQATTGRLIKGHDERGKYQVVWVRLAEGAADPVPRRAVNADLERE